MLTIFVTMLGVISLTLILVIQLILNAFFWTGLLTTCICVGLWNHRKGVKLWALGKSWRLHHAK